MNPQEKGAKSFSMAISNRTDNILEINELEKKERSLSTNYAYRNWMVPRLKPKPTTINPSPISLSINTLNLSREQMINRITWDSDTSMSFDGEDFSLNIEESDKSDSEAMRDMRQMMTSIRTRAKSEYFSKDDETILTSKNIAEEYSNLASKVLVPIVKMASSHCINTSSKTNKYALSPLLKSNNQNKRFNSIIEYLEDNYKYNSMCLPLNTSS